MFSVLFSTPPRYPENARNWSKSLHFRWFGGLSPRCPPGWNLKLPTSKSCFFLLKLIIKYYIDVRNTRGWLGGSKNNSAVQKLTKSWFFFWNLDFAWIWRISSDLVGFWLGFHWFWSILEGFRPCIAPKRAENMRRHVLIDQGMSWDYLLCAASLKTPFLDGFRLIFQVCQAWIQTNTY